MTEQADDGPLEEVKRGAAWRLRALRRLRQRKAEIEQRIALLNADLDALMKGSGWYLEKDGTRKRATVVHGTVESIDADKLWALDPHGWQLSVTQVVDKDKFTKAFNAGEISQEVAEQVIIVKEKKPYVKITDETQETPDDN